MFFFLRKYTSERVAIVLTGLVYAVMIMLVLYSTLYPQTALKYTAL
jgi:hypothetical protein